MLLTRSDAGSSTPANRGAAGERNTLVTIRKGGDKPPLFLVHDGNGEAIMYLNLARRLDPDRPVYGLLPRSSTGCPVVHTRTAEMAAYHIDKIRSIQPRGPYYLGGLCAGGVIAFEIARQLQAQNERVAMVALLDAPDVAARRKRWGPGSQHLRGLGAESLPTTSASTDGSALPTAMSAVGEANNRSSRLLRRRLQNFRDRIRTRLLRAYLDRGRSLPRFLEDIPVLAVCLCAERDYRPVTRFDGELVLFRAIGGEVDDAPFIEYFEDPLLGWGCRATRGVRVFDVPGGHVSMLHEPNVRVLAEQMQGYIGQVLGAETAGPRA